MTNSNFERIAIDDFLRLIEQDESIRKLVHFCADGIEEKDFSEIALAKKIAVSGLWGASQALVISYLYKKINTSILVIAPTLNKAEQIYNDIVQFLGIFPLPELPLNTDWKSIQLDAPLRLNPHCHLLKPTELSSLKGEAMDNEVMMEWIDTLASLKAREKKIIVAPVESALRKVVPGELFESHRLNLYEGMQPLQIGELSERLVKMGYEREDLVMEPGQFCVRGGIVDIFIPSYVYPVRIEFFDVVVDSIREFDPSTQKSRAKIKEINITPAKEILPISEILSTAMENLNKQMINKTLPDKFILSIAEKIKSRQISSSMYSIMPLFFKRLDTIFDYLSPSAKLVFLEPETIQQRIEEALHRAKFIDQSEEKPHLPWHNFLIDREIFEQKITPFKKLLFYLQNYENGKLAENIPSINFKTETVPNLQGKLDKLIDTISDLAQRYKYIRLVVPNQAMVKSLSLGITEYTLNNQDTIKRERLRAMPLGEKLKVILGDLSSQVLLPSVGLALLSATEIYEEKRKQFTEPVRRLPSPVTNLGDLKVGDYVVHIDHGIGRYNGVTTVQLGGQDIEALVIIYADEDKLYLPLEKLHLIQKFTGADTAAVHLDKLGGHSWQRTKAKVKKSIKDMAIELLNLYAARQVVKGHAFSKDDYLMSEFEAGFEYQETPDQLKAIEDVKADLEMPRPADRLICGDVGYGKTEVAMRAAFKVAMDGKQVAVLVPTTILAQQHLGTFRRRFKSFPVNIEMLSRFRTRKEQKEILEKLKNGDIDIIIGTHRLLQNDVLFKDLGLLIIDEEHRFGVAHKEKLKAYRNKVDVITLTATPIPRTLHISLMGLRDISIINTPPENRLPIITYVKPFSEELIRYAIEKELKRGGQVYFVHNRVQTIEAMAGLIKRLVPEVKLIIGHGQMSESALEKVMIRFLNGEFNLLLSTTIIESGLDIPTVNTIIIDRADQMGLAQLYQLRGRVGREWVQAYAYLLVPSPDTLSEVAKRRLEVIKELTALGSGFKLASYDLEIRGAGNLLGPEQHGHIAAVGFDFYCKLIEETVAELKGEQPPLWFEPILNLPVKTSIPSHYIPDTNQRIAFYQKLSLAKSRKELFDIRQELEDRYGRIPVEVDNLIEKMDLRMDCLKLGIEKIDFSSGQMALIFHQKTPVEIDSILALLRHYPREMKFTSERSLLVRLPPVNPDKIIPTIRSLLLNLRTK